MTYKDFKQMTRGIIASLTDQEVRALFVLCNEVRPDRIRSHASIHDAIYPHGTNRSNY